MDNFGTLIPEHQRQLVSIAGAWLANPDTLRTLRPDFVALTGTVSHLVLTGYDALLYYGSWKGGY